MARRLRYASAVRASRPHPPLSIVISVIPASRLEGQRTTPKRMTIQRRNKMKNVFGWTIAALFAFTLVAQAQNANQKDPPKVKVDAPGVRVEANGPGARDNANATDMRNWRASKIIGANVQNADQKSLGTVNDIILDGRGKAHYVILA